MMQSVSSLPIHGWAPRCVTIMLMVPATIGALKHSASFSMLTHSLHSFALREYFAALASFQATADAQSTKRHFERSDSIDWREGGSYGPYLGAMIGITTHRSTHCVALGMILFATAMASHRFQCFSIGRASAVQEHNAHVIAFSALVLLEDRLRHFAGEFICLFWISLGFAHVQILRGFGQASTGAAACAKSSPLVAMSVGRCLFATLCVWNVDNGSLLAGKGQLWSRKGDVWPPQRAAVHGISPSKTWAGIVGGLLVGVATGLMLAGILRRNENGDPQIWNTWLLYAARPCLPAVALVFLGMVLSVLAVAGDLVESALKRAGRIKDSGTIFPGHGGCLDRMDSLLLSIPAFCHASHAAQRMLQPG